MAFFSAAAARACSRTAAAARSGPRTRWPPSSSACAPAPTASSSTCACRPTASSVVCHDDTLERRPTREGPVRRGRRPSWRASMRGTDSSCGAVTFRSAARASAFRRCATCCCAIRDMPIIIEMKEDSAEMGHASRGRAGRRRRRARLRRRLRPAAPRRAARAARLATSACHRKCGWRSIARGAVAGAPRAVRRLPGARARRGGIRIVSPRFIRHAHAAGREVQVWTVDTEADMERLLGWGADGLISNRPDLAVSVRDAFVSGVRL